MVPPKTACLRKKNEELLNVLEENSRHLNRKVEICSELLRCRPRYCQEEFTDYLLKTPEMSPSTRLSRRACVQQPVRTLHNTSSRRAASALQIRSTSAGRIRSPRRGHSTCLPSRPISHESSTDNRWSKLQQDLACHAHMHGYTQSHARSKCYCTNKDDCDAGIIRTGSSTIVPELFTRKTRIPPRLKEKRYQASSPKKEPGSVKWIEPNGNRPVPDRLPDDMHRFYLPSEDCDQENRRQSTSLCDSSLAQGDLPIKPRCATTDKPHSEGNAEWFAKVKNFRKTNWDDCHAPERRKNDECDCQCNRVYMIGERMFLEPVTSAVLNKECCCSKPRQDLNPPPRDTVVTLPKVRPNKSEKSPQKKEDTCAPNRRPERFSGMYGMNKPCFLTGHKIRTDDDQIRAFVQQRPPDSFALRYQKGVDPRKP